METNNQVIDSEGTTPEEARRLLMELGENTFSGDIGKLAVALGRDEDELDAVLDGEANVDEDLLMKIRGIAQERGASAE